MPKFEAYVSSIFLVALNIVPKVKFLNEVAFGFIVKALVVPLVSNLPTHKPGSSVVPKVNAGWVNHVPLVDPVDFASVVFSKVIDIAWGSLEPFSAFQSKYLYLGIQT